MEVSMLFRKREKHNDEMVFLCKCLQMLHDLKYNFLSQFMKQSELSVNIWVGGCG